MRTGDFAASGAAIAGTIESSIGSASAAPKPRSRVRRFSALFEKVFLEELMILGFSSSGIAGSAQLH
jgi:hypothetical protein